MQLLKNMDDILKFFLNTSKITRLSRSVGTLYKLHIYLLTIYLLTYSIIIIINIIIIVTRLVTHVKSFTK